jgi:hypothetical protein
MRGLSSELIRYQLEPDPRYTIFWNMVSFCNIVVDKLVPNITDTGKPAGPIVFTHCTARIFFLSLLFTLSLGVQARELDDEWRYSIAFPMIWAPAINGKIRGGESVDFEIPFSQILDKLSFGIMFELYANRGPYGLAFKTNYMRVEDENSRSGLLDTRIETELHMGVNDLLASFRVHDKLRLVTGVRHVLAKMNLDIYSTLGNTEILNERIALADDNKFDLLFGINFNHWFNDKWGLMLNSDVGIVGDNDRDFSVDFRGLYRVSDLNNFWFGFRYLQIGSDVTTDGITYKIDMTQIGPTVGWAFTF